MVHAMLPDQSVFCASEAALLYVWKHAVSTIVLIQQQAPAASWRAWPDRAFSAYNKRTEKVQQLSASFGLGVHYISIQWLDQVAKGRSGRVRSQLHTLVEFTDTVPTAVPHQIRLSHSP